MRDDKLPIAFVDLDGTILNSRARLYNLFVELSGFDELSLDDYWQLKRKPCSNGHILSKIGKSPQEIALFNREWLDLVETERFLRMDTPQEDVLASLDTLSRLFNLILLTSRQSEPRALDQLGWLGLAEMFDRIIVTGQKRSKISTLTDLNVIPSSNDIVVGDTGVDIQVAQHFGATSVAIAGGFRNLDYLLTYRPDFSFATFADFVRAAPIIRA